MQVVAVPPSNCFLPSNLHQITGNGITWVNFAGYVLLLSQNPDPHSPPRVGYPVCRFLMTFNRLLHASE